MDKCNINFFDSSEVHTFYTPSKKTRTFEPTKVFATFIFMAIGIEETIFKTIIKLVIDLLA
jgi:hypothetical protein